jgi:phosphatidylinositol alpha-1,6-mannosyltransferase
MARVLVFLTDAFGGRGGIAQFNRDLLTTLSSNSAYTKIVALPRVVFDEPVGIPDRLKYRTASASGKIRYAIESTRATMGERFDAVICSHINLLPVAAAAAAVQRVPLLLVIYGIEAWEEKRGALVTKLLKRVDAVIAISEFTKKRFLEWAGVEAGRVHIMPCCVDMRRFGPGAKRGDLLRLYGLRGRSVILTVARLAGAERAKGIDEVLESLPALAKQIPNVSYLVVGDGPDRERLEAKARALGVANRVVFTGHIDENEKADHYRLADVFAMPGRGEGFGIVYLEALASGVPIVASKLDASVEVVLSSRMGYAVNPDKPAELQAAVVDLLSRVGKAVPRELTTFSLASFRARWNWFMAEMQIGDLAEVPMPASEVAYVSPSRFAEEPALVADAHASESAGRGARR